MMRPIGFSVLCLLAASLHIVLGSESDAKEKKMPVVGQLNKSFREVDEAVLAYMKEKSYTAAIVAISRDGQLLHQASYGWADEACTKPIKADAEMRIASISKLFTCAAIKQLYLQGKLKPDMKAFKYLDLKPLAGLEVSDPRIWDITIDQLIKHKGGWDEKAAGNLVAQTPRIAKECSVDHILSVKEFVQYLMTQKLQFTPGERESYSSAGYCVLESIIEKAAKAPYVKAVYSLVANRCKITSLQLGHATLETCTSLEPWYDNRGKTGISQLVLDRDEIVPATYGGFIIYGGCGGMIINAKDLVRFADNFWVNGDERQKNAKCSWVFYGSLPGTSSIIVQRLDGFNISGVINAREEGADTNTEFRNIVEKALDKVAAKLKQ